MTINGLAPNNTECGEWPMNKNGKYTLIFAALAEKLLKPHDLSKMPQSMGYDAAPLYPSCGPVPGYLKNNETDE